MDARPTTSTCAKCGSSMPATAAFCPTCGNPTGAVTMLPSSPETMLPTGLNLPSTGETGKTPRPVQGDAPTIGPTGARTSLDSPSPRLVHGAGPFVAGQQIGPRYTILKLLGQGGMGAVYQAFDHELGVAVAIKVIRPAAQSDETAAKELEQRFKRELVLARQVTHKYVVRIHDLGEIDGTKYLTMPFVEGETLAQVLRNSPTLPLDRVIKIAQQIAEGLSAAHDKGVVHRDLKPENIMIEKASEDPVPNSGDALIMDFGIARSVERGATQTAAGSVVGTLEYMAPEQAQGKKVDQRADLYALGLIIYDMLVGRARRTTHENPMTELIARMSTAPPSPRTINPEIPESINAIVEKLIDPNADNRYQSTRDLMFALNRLAPDGSIKSDVHEVIVHDAPARSKLAAAAIIIVLVGGVAGWMMSNRAPVVSAAHDPVSVLIGDVENKTGEAVLDGVVEQALTLGIEGASFINAFPRRDALRSATAINKTKLDQETARLVAFRENLGVAIVGSVEKKGAGYHISIKGLDPAPDGKEKFSLNDDAASKGEVLQTVASMAGDVRKALGDAVAPAANDAFTAANLDAVRAYAKGQELFATGKFEDAIAAYIEATKLDPEFGRGYSSAATAANNANKRDEAQKYYDLAMQKLDRMTEREKFRTRGQFYLFSRNPTAAIDQFKELVEKYPSDVQGMSNLANAHSQLREFDQAMAMGDRVAAMFPKNPLRQNNAALYAMYAGKFTQAIAKGKIASDLNKDYGLVWVSQGLASEALGNYDDAAAAYRQLSTINGWQARAALGIADMAMLRGRIGEASAVLEPMLLLKPPQQLTRVQTTLAAVRLAQGRVADAIKLAEDALKVSPNPDAITRYEAGRIFMAAGRAARAKEMAGELDKSLVLETRALGLTLLGEIQLIENDVRGAVSTLQQSLKIADTWMTHYILGRAYLAGQDFQSADTEFDKCESRKGEATAVYIDDLPTWRLMAPLYYYTGLTRSALKRATAADAFRTFVELKKGGDEKSSLVTDAERRLSQ